MKILSVFVAIVMITTLSPWQKMQASAETSASTSTATTAQQGQTDQAKTTATATVATPSTTAAATSVPSVTAPAVVDQSASLTSATINQNVEEPDSSPAVTPQSTAEEDGQYSITIDYVDQNGDKLQPSWQGLAANGAAWSQKSPDIEYYQLVDSAQATVSGTATGDNHFLTYTVQYKPIQATYTVVHQKQLNSGSYYTAETETFTAAAGTVVTAAAKTYSGYTCITADKTLTVTSDSKASITLSYNLTPPVTYTIYFYTQGSAVDPMNVAAGAAVTAPASPTRQGYDFVGWDVNDDGVAEGLPATMPNHNVYAKAVWKPALVNYVINYYKQNVDGTTYTLANTQTASGYTESQTPIAPKQETNPSDFSESTYQNYPYAWYTYDHETPVTIKADGSSVLDVYYNRDMITVKLQSEIGSGATLKNIPIAERQFRYGTSMEWDEAYKAFGITQNDVRKAYVDGGGTDTNYMGWWSDQWNRWSLNMSIVRALTDYSTKTAQFTTAYTSLSSHSYNYLTYTQNLDGTFSSTPSSTAQWIRWSDANRYYSTSSATGFHLAYYRQSPVEYDGTNYGSLTWGDWTEIDAASVAQGYFNIYTRPNGTNLYTTEIRLERNTYPAHYYSAGTEVATTSHLYQAPYSTGEVDGTKITPPAEGLTFAGWYQDENFTVPAVDETQGVGQDVYYAKWAPAQVTVSFDSEGGTSVENQTFDKGKKASRPEDPTKEGYSFDSWYYRGADGTAVPVYFEFDQPVEADATLYAQWIQTTPSASTDYTVIHRTASGTVLATERGSGIAGEAVGASALATSDPLRKGYAYVDGQNKSITLSENSSDNVITFVYTNDGIYTYTVHYVDRATGKQLAEDYAFTSKENLVDVDAITIDGYTVEGATGWVSSEKPEYTFYYNAPTTPAGTISDSSGSASAAASDALPKTDDASPLAALLTCALVGAAAAAYGRRKVRE